MHRSKTRSKGLALRAKAQSTSCEAVNWVAISATEMLTPTISLSSQAEQQEDSKTRPGHDADEGAIVPYRR